MNKKDKVMRLTEKEKKLIELLRDRDSRNTFERMLIFSIMESEETMGIFDDCKDFVIYREALQHKRIAEIVKGLISNQG